LPSKTLYLQVVLHLSYIALLDPYMQTDGKDKNLQLLLMVTDLLATCAVGENKATESICWTVFTVEELLIILNSTSIPLNRKRPFARFLVWVYMNAGGSKMQKGASHLSHSRYVTDLNGSCIEA